MESLEKLGIDGWGLIVYLVNFGILWAAMAYLVFPKIIRLIDQRKATIEDNLKTAEEIQAQLSATLTTAQQEKEELTAALAEERAQLEKDLTKQRSELFAAADEERNKLLEEARKLIREEKKLLINQTEGEMIGMMQRVLIKILGEQVDPEDVAASVRSVWDQTKEEVVK